MNTSRMKRWFVLVLLLISYTSYAHWPPMTAQEFARLSPLIVAGKIVKTSGKKKETAYIKVSKIYKNLLSDLRVKEGDVLEVKMGPEEIEECTDIHYEKGREGIWLLYMDSRESLSINEHPVQFQEQKKEGITVFTNWLTKL